MNMTTTAVEKQKPFELTGNDHRYLEALFQYHYLTASQLTHLFYKMGMLTTVKARLKRLVDNKYLQAIRLPTTKAKSPYVYTLAAKGIAHLERMGYELTKQYRPSKEEEKSWLFLYHTLGINDFLLACLHLQQYVSGLKLETVLHDLTLKHDPCLVTLHKKRQDGSEYTRVYHLVPDSWVHFILERGSKSYHKAVWLELDRASVDVKPFKEKLRSILVYFKSKEYHKRFATKSLVVCFATTGGKQRVEQMRKWIREELSATKEPPYLAKMFYSTALPQTSSTDGQKTTYVPLDAQVLFLSPVWYLPFDDKPVSLFTLE